MMRWLRLMFIGLCAGGSAGILAQVAEPVGQAEDIVTVETVLSWIERYQRIDAENAELLRQSLDRRADRVARLELALLEIHAPAPVAEPMRGLERLNVLVDAADDALWVTSDAKRMLVLFLDQAQTIQSLRQQSEANAGRLERERRAHLDTLEKLDALRSIERDLEQRQSSEEAAEPEEGEDPDDGPNSARQRR